MADLERMFPWAMANTSRNYVRPDPRPIKGPFAVKDLLVTPIPVIHPSVETFGFRFDFPTGHSLAYISDVKEIPGPSIALLQELDIFVVDALRPQPHPTHMNVEEALAVITQLNPKQSFLTHLAHEIDAREAAFQLNLPEAVALARDGLKLHFERQQHCSILYPPPR